MIHTAISSTVDGSVVVAIDMNVSDAEKELARLKKEIFKLENDVGRNAAQKASLQEKYTEKLSQYNKFLKEHTQRDEDGKFITPEDGKTADLLYKEVLKIWENINKYDEALRDSNVSLHWTKNRYGEIAREAEKLRAEAEKTASAANASDAGFEKMSQEAEEVNRKLHELADQYANLAEEGVDFDPNSEKFLKLRQEIKDCVLYLDKLAESGQLSELSSGAEIAEDRIADLTNTIEEYQYRLDNYDLSTDQREILGEKVEKGKQLLESYQSILDKISDKAKETEVANQHIVNLNKELLSLKQRQKELEGRGFGIGHVEYDKNATRIKKINQELKEYEKTLIEVSSTEEATKPTESIVSEMDQAMEKESKSLEKLAQSQSRLNAFLEKSSSLHQKFSNMISKTTEMSSLLQDVAAATTGKMSGMFQSAGTALSGFSTKLSGIASKAGPYIAIAVAIIGIVKKLTKSFSDFGKTAANAFTTAVNSAKKLAPLLAELGSLAASSAKKVLLFVKNLNVFPKLSENLSRKFKRLGSTIKSALVFSVMYKGLSILREQMGKYLSVNTQFMTALRRLQGVLLTAFQPIYVKFYKGDDLVSHVVPCVNPSGKATLYDVVQKTEIQYASTLTAGPAI